MASIACVVTVLISVYAASLLAAPSQDLRRLSNDVIEPSHRRLELNATTSPEDLALHHQHNVRRTNDNSKLLTAAGRPSTRRSEPGDPLRGDTHDQEPEVAIIVAQLKPGAEGSPAAARPYRVAGGTRALAPLHDHSHETLADILHALKRQLSGRENAGALHGQILANATHTDSFKLDGPLAPPLRSKANESVDDEKKVPHFSLDDLAETYTEPTFESVVRSRADAKTASTPPSEYFDDYSNYETKTKLNLGYDEIFPLKHHTKTSAENKFVLGHEPKAIEKSGTIFKAENPPHDILEYEPMHYLQTGDGASGPCVTDDASTQADSQCDACQQEDSPCGACRHGDTKCEAHKQADNDDVTTSPPGACPAAQLSATQKDDTEDADKKEDVGLGVNRKSYKISIIFQ